MYICHNDRTEILVNMSLHGVIRRNYMSIDFSKGGGDGLYTRELTRRFTFGRNDRTDPMGNMSLCKISA